MSGVAPRLFALDVSTIASGGVSLFVARAVQDALSVPNGTGIECTYRPSAAFTAFLRALLVTVAPEMPSISSAVESPTNSPRHLLDGPGASAFGLGVLAHLDGGDFAVGVQCHGDGNLAAHALGRARESVPSALAEELVASAPAARSVSSPKPAGVQAAS